MGVVYTARTFYGVLLPGEWEDDALEALCEKVGEGVGYLTVGNYYDGELESFLVAEEAGTVVEYSGSIPIRGVEVPTDVMARLAGAGFGEPEWFQSLTVW